ncbi:class II aldolase/adducin family protein [Candidatus Bathyarchaeota archaeon]|nr:class II aldolase/adducin family protein [Candidatus Bathyarchaeota archaeon]MBS7613030.1 class II aldolase/adducin family protein [Candidatus Bathyarchaeota archaeon]MBS7618187.1 class II aldolase/adducin family protein [Candidatus Bathyarchaeota archaeon]
MGYIDEENVKRELIEVMKIMHDKGLMTGIGGNVSYRMPETNEVWITPSGLYKPKLNTEDLVKIDLEGNLLEGVYKPSMEWPIHTSIYKRRVDVNCVLHCHPPYATGLILAGVEFRPITLEAALMIARALTVPFIYPGTKELGEAVAEAAMGSRVILLQNHGAVTLGYDIYEAVTAMEILEECAKMTFVAKCMGVKPTEISERDIELLRKLYKL